MADEVAKLTADNARLRALLGEAREGIELLPASVQLLDTTASHLLARIDAELGKEKP